MFYSSTNHPSLQVVPGFKGFFFLILHPVYLQLSTEGKFLLDNLSDLSFYVTLLAGYAVPAQKTEIKISVQYINIYDNKFKYTTKMQSFR